MENKRDFKIVIVGSEQKKWTKDKETICRALIHMLMEAQPEALYISGECHLGGVDQWVKEIAQNLNKRYRGYPPKKNSWYYYKKRNIQMAKEGNLVIDLEPEGFTSGGTWTVKYAKSIGKVGVTVEI